MSFAQLPFSVFIGKYVPFLARRLALLYNCTENCMYVPYVVS